MSISDPIKLVSGAKVNRDKIEAMFFGDWIDQLFIPFAVRTDYLKVLGICFGGARACTKSWEERIAEVKQKLDLWKHCSLSIVGKNLVI
eukprot:g17173.t1